MIYFHKNEETQYPGFCCILNNEINVISAYLSDFPEGRLYIETSQLRDIFEFEDRPEGAQDFGPIWKSGMVKFDNSCNAHTLCDPEKIKNKNLIYKRFFRLKEENYYLAEKDKFICEKTLGIQIRGTDKHIEVTPPSNENIISHIRSMIDKHDIERIFLATDDIKYKNLIVGEFGKMVSFRENTISTDGRPIHHTRDRSLINKEVMLDVYLLSQCKYLLYCFSNVSHSALILGIENFIDYDCINIKQFK